MTCEAHTEERQPSRSQPTTAPVPHAGRQRQSSMPMYKPSQILRLVRTKRIADPQPKGTGTIMCEEFRHVIRVGTEKPTLWESGMYVYCPACKANKLARIRFADFEIDLQGERRVYPLTMRARKSEMSCRNG